MRMFQMRHHPLPLCPQVFFDSFLLFLKYYLVIFLLGKNIETSKRKRRESVEHAREALASKRRKTESEEKHKERNIRYNNQHTTWSVTKELDLRVRGYQERLRSLRGAFHAFLQHS